MQISRNPDNDQYQKITKAIKNNNGYCLNCNEFIPENKCPCTEFIESKKIGLCKCGRYVKTEV